MGTVGIGLDAPGTEKSYAQELMTEGLEVVEAVQPGLPFPAGQFVLEAKTAGKGASTNGCQPWP